MKSHVSRNKAFTLIELLAVIIIIGILAIIAIPSISKYISNSRKETYVDSAKSLINGSIDVVNSGTLEMSDKNTTYYIPIEKVRTEMDLKTPYGEFTEAYIGVTCDDKGYTYYWTSRDSAGVGVKELVPVDKLDINDIVENIEENEITNNVKNIGIGNRTNIKVLNSEGQWDSYTVSDTINNYLENGNLSNVVYPEGKTKSTVVSGDLITIGTEDFYVVKHDENNNLVLLSRYNLKVGSIYNYTTRLVYVGEYTSSDPGYEMQSSEATGYLTRRTAFKGGMSFSSEAYWEGEGVSHPLEIYGEGSKLKKHIDNYVKKLEVVVKESRLLKGIEAEELGCNIALRSCSGAPSYVTSISYWLNSSYINGSVLSISYEGYLLNNSDYRDGSFGVRPVIII